MNFGKAIGWGIVLWVVAFILSIVFSGFGNSIIANLIAVLLVGVVAWLLARNFVKPKSAGEGFGYGVVWVVIMFLIAFILSALNKTPLTLNLTTLVAYVLVLIAPALAVKK